MSTDIFISYRHGDIDSWIAERLYERLARQFAVFFDTNRQRNDYGDDFAENIGHALASCRVMFAVVGPDWVAEMHRLHNPDDWVRKELVCGLTHEHIRVVPLFTRFKVRPTLSTLPEDLRPFDTLRNFTLSREEWDTEADRLADNLNEWLKAGRRDTRHAVATLPPVLPFLCNRFDQEDALAEIIARQQATAPIACVVHGHKDEAHDEFLERLRHREALERILGGRDTGIAGHILQIARGRLRTGPASPPLISALKGALLNDRTAHDDQLRAHLIALPQPLVAVLQITWSDVEELGETLIGNLVTAWREILRTPGNGEPPPLRFPAVLWINVTYDDRHTELTDDVLVQPLPKLGPIVRGYIKEWLGLDEVKLHVAHHKNTLEDLAEAPRYCFEPGKLHMRRFAEGVRDVMTNA